MNKLTKRKNRRTPRLESSILREFDGGLNSSDSEYNMNPNYFSSMTNVDVNDDGSISVRNGAKFLKLLEGEITDNVVRVYNLAIGSGDIYIQFATPRDFERLIGHEVWFTGITAPEASILNANFFTIAEVINYTTIRVDATTYGWVSVSIFDTASAGTGTSRYSGTADYIKDVVQIGDDVILAVQGSYDVSIYYAKAEGTFTLIFNDYIASGLPGSPTAWAEIKYLTVERVQNELVITNGINKPLVTTFNDPAYPYGRKMTYLNDAATGSNVNTPEAIECAKVGDYLILLYAGDVDPDLRNHIYVSAQKTKGTFYNDPPPNDAIRVNISSLVAGAGNVISLKEFKGKLVVIFDNKTAIVNVGTYDENGEHILVVENTIQGFYTQFPRSVISSGSDLFLINDAGIFSLNVSAISQQLTPISYSDIINDTLKPLINKCYGTTKALELTIKSCFDHNNHKLYLHIAGPDLNSEDIYVGKFIYKKSISRPKIIWTKYTIPHALTPTDPLNAFRNLFTSLSGNLFMWDSQCSLYSFKYFVDNIEYISMVDEVTYGTMLSGPITVPTPIEFNIETPWLYFGNRDITKMFKFFNADIYAKAVIALTENASSPELITNSTFDTGITGWTLVDGPTGSSIYWKAAVPSSLVISKTSAPPATVSPQTTITGLEVGEYYFISSFSYVTSNLTARAIRVYDAVTGERFPEGATNENPGLFTYYYPLIPVYPVGAFTIVKATATTAILKIESTFITGTTRDEVDRISMKKLDKSYYRQEYTFKFFIDGFGEITPDYIGVLPTSLDENVVRQITMAAGGLGDNASAFTLDPSEASGEKLIDLTLNTKKLQVKITGDTSGLPASHQMFPVTYPSGALPVYYKQKDLARIVAMIFRYTTGNQLG